MSKKFKTFSDLHPHEGTEFKPLSKKQKLRYFNTKGKSKVKSNLKSHFPNRIWNNASENRKGHKV